MESDSSNDGPQAVIANLQNSLVQAVQQNNELRTRLNNIHASSDIREITEPVSLILMTLLKMYPLICNLSESIFSLLKSMFHQGESQRNNRQILARDCALNFELEVMKCYNCARRNTLRASCTNQKRELTFKLSMLTT